MNAKSTLILFLDDDPTPIARLSAPVTFELDTTRLVDGRHTLRIVSRDAGGKEGIRIIPFEVRNGPAIAVEGLKDEAIVDGILPLMINAYGKGDARNFVITGSETPQSIPFWIFIFLIAFIAWAIYFLISSNAINLFK
ncbi:cytochrome C [Puia sp.]|jgi:hypothetical protein|uniref:cytochrome C n=1 Tax=Puia sp. TaxID=2045100 RepID=UPI002F415B93